MFFASNLYPLRKIENLETSEKDKQDRQDYATNCDELKNDPNTCADENSASCQKYKKECGSTQFDDETTPKTITTTDSNVTCNNLEIEAATDKCLNSWYTGYLVFGGIAFVIQAVLLFLRWWFSRDSK